MQLNRRHLVPACAGSMPSTCFSLEHCPASALRRRITAAMVAAGPLIIAVWPTFPLVLAALVLQGITGGFLGLAIAAISLGLVGNAALGERLGRNQRFASTGGVVAAGLMGLIAYFLSYRAIFFVAAALVLPLLAALDRIQPSDIHFGRASRLPDHQGPSASRRARRRRL
jgi:MFS family permease